MPCAYGVSARPLRSGPQRDPALTYPHQTHCNAWDTRLVSFIRSPMAPPLAGVSRSDFLDQKAPKYGGWGCGTLPASCRSFKISIGLFVRGSMSNLPMVFISERMGLQKYCCNHLESRSLRKAQLSHHHRQSRLGDRNLKKARCILFPSPAPKQ